MEGHEPKPSAISAGLKLQCNYNAGTDLIFFVNLKNMRKNHLRYLYPLQFGNTINNTVILNNSSAS